MYLAIFATKFSLLVDLCFLPSLWNIINTRGLFCSSCLTWQIETLSFSGPEAKFAKTFKQKYRYIDQTR